VLGSLEPVLTEARLKDPIMAKKQWIEISELEEYEKDTQESISTTHSNQVKCSSAQI